MDSMRGLNGSLPAGAGRASVPNESPEQLLDVFKAAALSVTKLYKTSTMAQSKARSEGYQDCLDDLLAFLDQGNLGLSQGEGWKIRRWATEKLDGRDSGSQNTESEDESEKTDTAPSLEHARGSGLSQPSHAPMDTTQSNLSPVIEEPTPIVVPTQDTFTFQSPYPNIATLDLSDSRTHDGSSITPRSVKGRLNAAARPGPRSSAHLGQRAGSKRKLNFDEIFDLGSLSGKDPFGNGGKRNRHA